MKILQVLHFFLPRHSAGTEVYTDALARGLKERGHHIELFFTEKILSRPSYALLRREHAGMRCHVLVNNLLYDGFRETFENEAVEARFGEVLDEVKPDVVHFQHLMLLSMRLPALAAERGIDTVMTLHDFWLFCARFGQLLEHGEKVCQGPTPDRCAACITDFKYSQSPLQKKVISAIRWTKEIAGFDLAPVVDAWRKSPLAAATKLLPRRRKEWSRDAPREPSTGDGLAAGFAARLRAVEELVPHVGRFFSPSRTVRDRMVEYGLPAEKVEVLPLGIHQFDVKPRRAVAGRTPVFGFIGTIAPHKGVHVAIEAIRYLKRHGELIIYGRTDYYPGYVGSLKAQAQGLSVRFAGAVSRAELGIAFRAIDVLIMPSVWLENYPIIIQEARAAKVPVVASNLGGMSEAINDGVDGLLFRAGDAADLARTLARLIHHPSLVDEMSSRMSPPITLDHHVGEVERRLRQFVREEAG